MKTIMLFIPLILFSSIAAAECIPDWECDISDCSGGIQIRICRDSNNCRDVIFEEHACGGSAFHGDFSAGGIKDEPWECTEGARYCGNEGVVQCQGGRLVQIQECSIGCYMGFCIDGKSQEYFDLITPFYIASSIVILAFGSVILYYGFFGNSPAKI
jgi:hypothetical protein